MLLIVVTGGFLHFATKAKVGSKSLIYKTHAPLIRMTKREIIGKEFELGQTMLELP